MTSSWLFGFYFAKLTFHYVLYFSRLGLFPRNIFYIFQWQLNEMSIGLFVICLFGFFACLIVFHRRQESVCLNVFIWWFLICSCVELTIQKKKYDNNLHYAHMTKLRKPGRDIEKKFFCRGEYFLGRGEYFLGRGEYFLPRGIFSGPRVISFAAGNIFSAAGNIFCREEYFLGREEYCYIHFRGNIFWAAGNIFCRGEYFLGRGEYCYISFPRRIFNFRGEYFIPRVIFCFRGEHSSFHIRGEYSIPAVIFHFLLETSLHSMITPVFHIKKLRRPHTRACAKNKMS